MLIDDAKLLEAGADECRRAEMDAYYCCNYCPGGVIDPATGECPPPNDDSERDSEDSERDMNGGHIAQALSWMESFWGIAFLFYVQ
jgi:hypothetical protein